MRTLEAAGPLAVNRVLRILELLAEHGPQGVSLAGVSTALQAPRSSTFTLLQALQGLGFAGKRDHRFVLGDRAFALCAQIQATRSEWQVVEPVMCALAARTGHAVTCSAFLRDRCQLVHRHVVPGRRMIRNVVKIGARWELYNSAGGRAILAHCPPAWRDAYLEQSAASAPKSRRLRERTEAFVKAVSREGFGVSLGDADPAVGSVAGALLLADGSPIGSLNVAGPLHEVSAARWQIGALVHAAAQELSLALRQAGIVELKG